jgi:hypothetical protein
MDSDKHNAKFVFCVNRLTCLCFGGVRREQLLGGDGGLVGLASPVRFGSVVVVVFPLLAAEKET